MNKGLCDHALRVILPEIVSRIAQQLTAPPRLALAKA
jgi:hypothetical protein